jgi:hypothetical protein
MDMAPVVTYARLLYRTFVLWVFQHSVKETENKLLWLPPVDSFSEIWQPQMRLSQICLSCVQL